VIVLMAPESQLAGLDALIADLVAEGTVQAVLRPQAVRPDETA
jgi:hypothetical protein